MSMLRLKKILRDLWDNLPRSMLAIFAIAIGMFGTGFVLNAFSMLNREIDANYKMANPASATIWMDNVDANALNAANRFPGIAITDKTSSIVRGRIEVAPGEWDILQLNVVDDFKNIRINRIFPVSGDWPTGDGQIVLERASMSLIGSSPGVSIMTVGGTPHQMNVSGTVFDPSQDPAWVNNILVGYITPGTLKWLGGQTPQTGLRILLSGNPSREQITETTAKLGSLLQQEGYHIQRAEVPIPGKYPQTDKINSLLLTMVLFGSLCLALSAFLTATLISAILSRQIRQIGMMKAVGARTMQTMGMYFGTVLLLSAAALVIGIPLGAAAGRAFALATMNLLNFDVTNSALPVWSILVQAGIGLIVPLGTALYPIYKGNKITVRESLSDYGVDLKNFGTSRIDRLLERIRFLPRILALSLKNSFRRRGRLILALVMLSLGGAAFIASLGSAASWNLTIDNAFKNINYDIDVRLGSSYEAGAIENSIRTIPGVATAEAWGYSMSTSFPKYNDNTYGGAYAIFAPPENSAMIQPPLLEGRWLSQNDTNAMVVDTDFIDNAAKQGTPIKRGDDITFQLNGKDTIWHVVGIMDKIGFQSAAYVNYDYFTNLTGTQGKAACVRVSVQGHDKNLQKSVAGALENKLGAEGFKVFVIQDLTLTRQVMVNHVILILTLLLFMSILVAAVGALGLASVTAMNVMERTREIGIMRSIGAASGAIKRSVVFETLITAFLSWILATLVSIPLTFAIAGNTGQFIFPRIMEVTYPWWPPLLWLGIILIVAVAASYLTARRAARLTIRDTLAYE